MLWPIPLTLLFVILLFCYTTEAGITHAKMTRYLYRDSLHWAALKPAFGLWCFCEILRLNLGARGISNSNVPNLVSFLLLTIFPQTFLTLYIGFLQECLVTTDQYLGGVSVGLLALEIVFVLESLRLLTKLRSQEYMQKSYCNQRNIQHIYTPKKTTGEEIEQFI